MRKKYGKHNHALEAFLDWSESIVFAVFMVIFLFTFVFRVAVVHGVSMESTLYEGDMLVISHLFYVPETKDIIVVNSSAMNETIIKRVIATTGQTVSIDCEEGAVYVDGDKLNEPYVSVDSFQQSSFDMSNYNSSTDRFDYKVPFGYVFVMGDNRDHSTDSRAFGFIPKSEIVGRVIFRAYSRSAGTGRVE